MTDEESTMSENTSQPTFQPEPQEQVLSLHREATGELAVVMLHNDDSTPYDYVIQTLGSLFLISDELADHIAWTAHTRGQAVVVVRPRSEAEKLVKVACARAKTAGFPLIFSLEKE
jgi:ATP-dependent Clp protease adaptor protein ClpS